MPSPAEALAEPFRAFPSWFLKVACDRCGNDSMLNEEHMSEHRRGMMLRANDGVPSRPMRRIVLTDGA